MNNRTNNNDNGHVVEQISSYLDGALDDATGDYVLAHIEKCAECHAEYVEVRVTRQLLRSVSTVAPPRTFTLTQEMVTRRVWLWHRLLVPRNAPRLATGSLMTFALVALLLVSNLGGVFSPAANMSASSNSARIFEAAPTQLTPYAQLYSTTPPDQRSMESLMGTPAAVPAVPSTGETSGIMDKSALSTATTVIATNNIGVPELQEGTPAVAGGDVSRTGQATAVSSQAAISPPGDSFMRMPQSPETASQPLSAQPNPDGGQVLTFALISLLVALGGALAVGAVVAARR